MLRISRKLIFLVLLITCVLFYKGSVKTDNGQKSADEIGQKKLESDYGINHSIGQSGKPKSQTEGRFWLTESVEYSPARLPQYRDQRSGKYPKNDGEDVLDRNVSRGDSGGTYGRVYHMGNSDIYSITAYTAGKESTGKQSGDPAYGITASGTKVAQGRTVAADWAVLPPGTLIVIDGLPHTYVVEDTGSAIRGKKLDLYFEKVSDALKWGRQKRKVTVVKRPDDH